MYECKKVARYFKTPRILLQQTEFTSDQYRYLFLMFTNLYNVVKHLQYRRENYK